MAGMVWNDYFDIVQDRRERPFRPLPSGRVTRPAAFWLGTGLLVAGFLLAVLADVFGSAEGQTGFRWRASVLAGCLAGAVLLYDAWLKRTLAGPLAMGLCRFLNVLLGLSIVPEPLGSWGWLLALVVGLYITGVTWFARTEARASSVRALKGAAFVMFAAVMLGLAVPALFLESAAARTSLGNQWQWGSFLFPYALLVFLFAIGRPVLRAIAHPVPERVQAAVKRSILGLVLLDAVLAMGLIGVVGLAICLLLLPAAYVGRWIYST